MEITKDKIIFGPEDWLSGLDPQFDADGFQIGKQLSQAVSFNPYRYRGLAAPGYNPNDVTNVSIVDAVLLKAVTQTLNAYVSSNGTKLFRIDSLSGVPSLTNNIGSGGNWPHTVTGASILQDVIDYWINLSSTRTECILYSWKDGSNGNVGRYNLAADTFDDDWLSTIPANAAVFDTTNDHPMIVGDDDILYLGDGNKVHAVDGATGTDSTLNKGVLVLPKGFIITSFVKLNQFLVVVGYGNLGSTISKGYAKAYFWDYVSLDPTYAVDIDDYKTTEALNYQGSFIVASQGVPTDQNSDNSKYVKIKKFIGFDAGFEELCTFDKTIPVRGGIDVRGHNIFFNAGGTVYLYDGKLRTLNAVAAGTGTTSGMLATFIRTQFISSGITTAGGLQLIGTATTTTPLTTVLFAASANVYTGLARPIWLTDNEGKIERVRIRFGKTSTGGGTLQFNYETA